MGERFTHPYDPIVPEGSRILIVGTFPSPKSRGTGFYYAHPQNRFWRTISCVFDVPLPECVTPEGFKKREKSGGFTGRDREEAARFLERCGAALWDSISFCEVDGALDSKIRDAVPSDIAGLLGDNPGIEAVAANGNKAHSMARKAMKGCGIPLLLLPSTSPANASGGYHDPARLCAVWREILAPWAERSRSPDNLL